MIEQRYKNTYKISVGLYLRGAGLDPAKVSDYLGKTPDRSQYKGERQRGGKGREYLRNIGLWAIETKLEPESGNLEDYIDDLLSKIDFNHENISHLNDIEEAYIDIFVAAESDQSSSGTCDFEMSPHQITELSRIGLPVRFTIAIVKATE